jgi:cell division protein FtsZ
MLGLRKYRSLLATDKARPFVVAGFVGRLPMSMRVLGAILLVRQTSGSYALSGAVAGTLTLAQALAAPPASAGSTGEEVTIRTMQPKPSLFIEPAAERAAPAETPADKTFIPPQPERAPMRPRMPRIEELPIPAQNEIRAKRAAAAAEADKPRMSLLQRIASVGLGRRDEPPGRPQLPRPPARPQAERLPPYPARPQESRAPEGRPQEPVSEYARRSARPAPQGLDPHGRSAPVAAAPLDDDQLEIPAFLRRQAN